MDWILKTKDILIISGKKTPHTTKTALKNTHN